MTEVWATPYSDARRQARAARGQIERALDGAGWPWSRTLSLWLDHLSVIEDDR